MVAPGTDIDRVIQRVITRSAASARCPHGENQRGRELSQALGSRRAWRSGGNLALPAGAVGLLASCVTLAMDTNATASSGALPGNARQTESRRHRGNESEGWRGQDDGRAFAGRPDRRRIRPAPWWSTSTPRPTPTILPGHGGPGYEVVHELDPPSSPDPPAPADFDTILVDRSGSLKDATRSPRSLPQHFRHHPRRSPARARRSCRPSGQPCA